MAQKKKDKKAPAKDKKDSMVDVDKLKSFGIIKDGNKDDIEEIDGSNVTGGKDDTTVDTHWPTTTGA